MKIGGKEIILKGSPEIPFPHYRTEKVVKKISPWRNLTPDVELIFEKFSELQERTVTRTKEQALLLAKEKALAGVKQNLPRGAIILNERVEELVTPQPEDLVRVRAQLEVIEDIGEKRPFLVK
jgi:similar to stage IV sporulation protein